jgi:hypothetical protein
MDKKNRKEILDRLNKEKLIEFRQNLPIDEVLFPKLFDFLDTELEKNGCNHSPFITKSFLQKNSISNIIEVTEWLAKNGGYCDCEILANVEDLFEYLNPPKIKTIPEQNTHKRKISSLKTDFNFCIEKIPSPWNLIEITSTDNKEYLFQIGKSNNCTVNLQSDFSSLQHDDAIWIKLWVNETKLNYNLANLCTERFEIGNYSAIIVKTKDWAPVKIWCTKKDDPQWFLKMNTELNRYKGDLKEFEKLLNSIV